MSGASIQRVELFECGTYDVGTPLQKTYDPAYLDGVVANFNRLSSGPKPLYQPPVVVGHEDDQRLLERMDLPAGGWVKRIWRIGSKLLGDLGEIPATVADWINRRLYRKVSAEFYDHPSQGGLPGTGPVLRRIALLGGHPPKVKTLADLPFARFAEGKAPRVQLRPSRSVRKTGYVRLFAEVAMDRDTMLAMAAEFGFSKEFLDSLSDEQLGMLIKDKVAGGGGGDAPPAAANAEPATRDELIAALVQMGQDAAVVAAMDDAALKALWAQLNSAGGAPPAAANADPASPAPASNPAPASAPSPQQVIYKYGETVLSKVQAADRLASQRLATERKKSIDSFCERMVQSGKLTPAQVEVDRKTGRTLGSVRQRLERASAVRKFGEGLSELDLQMAEIEAGPIVRKFGETIPQPGVGGGLTADRKKQLLGATPLGKATLTARK